MELAADEEIDDFAGLGGEAAVASSGTTYESGSEQ